MFINVFFDIYSKYVISSNILNTHSRSVNVNSHLLLVIHFKINLVFIYRNNMFMKDIDIIQDITFILYHC